MKARLELASLDFDRIIHEKTRLMILTCLASGQEAETGFTELRDILALSAGNLSIQLKNLEEAGYIAIAKRFQENKPYTGVRLTTSGQDALERYLATMQQLVDTVRRPGSDTTKKTE